MIKKIARTISSFALVLFISGLFAAVHAQTGYYEGQEATVLQSRPVKIEQPGPRERALGTLVGGSLGAALGHTLARKSNSRSGRILAAGLGAALGGVAGHKVTQHLSRRDAQEVVLLQPNGRTIAVVQPMQQHLQPGDSVHLVRQRGQTRIIPTAYRPQQRLDGNSSPEFRTPSWQTAYSGHHPEGAQRQQGFQPMDRYPPNPWHNQD